MASLYDVLGVAEGASPADIRSAYLRRVLESHPDKGGDACAFRAVVFAFQILSDSTSRPGFAGQGGSRGGSPLRRGARTAAGKPEAPPREAGAGAAEERGRYLQRAIEVLQSMSTEARRAAILAEFSNEERLEMEAVLSRPREPGSLPGGPEGRVADSSSSCGSSEESDVQEAPKRRRPRRGKMISDAAMDEDLLCQANRGINRTVFVDKQGNMTVYYNAEVCINCNRGLYLYVYSRKRRELARCVQDHIALTQVMEHARASSQATWDSRISEAFEVMMRDHGLTLGSGRRNRGASTQADFNCLYLRYRVHVNFDYKYDTNFLSPLYFDLHDGLRAFHRLCLVRGSCDIGCRTPFSELQQILSRVRLEVANLHLEEAAKGADGEPDLGVTDVGAAAAAGDRTKGRIEQLFEREARFLARRDAGLLRRLQRLVVRERSRAAARQRRAEATQQAAARRLKLLRRKAVFHWDPHETHEARKRRLADMPQL
mmetsp:Transcript_120495/g.341448  ORF Transcript_120495/g.341448 Transcript_120495/m.341448 type:complete len:487 (+) Transcript_120495:51-1511(+)